MKKAEGHVRGRGNAVREFFCLTDKTAPKMPHNTLHRHTETSLLSNFASDRNGLL